MRTQLAVTFPDGSQDKYDTPRKVMYLLHGITNNAISWISNTAIERYANSRNIIVIMPEVQRSFYCNMKYGQNYFDYIAKELPEICRDMFNISSERENTFIAGLSMGGYGALKTAFIYPENYGVCGSFSGAVDIKGIFDFLKDSDEQIKKEAVALIGSEGVVQEENDIFCLVDQLIAKKSAFPKIYLSCGKQDYLYLYNQKLKKYLEDKQIEHNYMEWDGEHTWDFWDKSVQYFMDYATKK